VLLPLSLSPLFLRLPRPSPALDVSRRGSSSRKVLNSGGESSNPSVEGMICGRPNEYLDELVPLDSRRETDAISALPPSSGLGGKGIAPLSARGDDVDSVQIKGSPLPRIGSFSELDRLRPPSITGTGRAAAAKIADDESERASNGLLLRDEARCAGVGDRPPPTDAEWRRVGEP
jgi:hypothetical protein